MDHVHLDLTERNRPLDFPVLMRDDRIVSCLRVSDTLRNVPIVAVDYVFIATERRLRAAQWMQSERSEIVYLNTRISHEPPPAPAPCFEASRRVEKPRKLVRRDTRSKVCSFALQEGLFSVPLEFRFVLYRHGPYSVSSWPMRSPAVRSGHAPRRAASRAVWPEPRSRRRCGGGSWKSSSERPRRARRQLSLLAPSIWALHRRRIGAAHDGPLRHSQKEKAATASERAEQLRELKPHIRPEDAERAVRRCQQPFCATWRAGIEHR